MADSNISRTPPVLRRNRSAATSCGGRSFDNINEVHYLSKDGISNYNDQGSIESNAPVLRKQANLKQHPTIRPGMYKRDGGVFVTTSRGVSEQVLSANRGESIDAAVGNKRRSSGSASKVNSLILTSTTPSSHPSPLARHSLRRGESENTIAFGSRDRVEPVKKGDSLKRLPPVLKQRAKLSINSNLRNQHSVIPDGEDTQSVPTWNTYRE